MPTKTHQQLVHAILSLLLEFLRATRAGDAVAAPYRMRIREGTFREPDIVVYTAEHLQRFGERFGEAADLVVEVVSDDASSRARDYEDKRRDYADAGIPEYWIVDPTTHRVLVLSRITDSTGRGSYEVAGEYQPGQMATSHLLTGFSVDVTALFAQP